MGVHLIGATAAVTGAGRGIGRATASALVRAGARVVLGDLDADLARQAAAGLGRRAIGLPLDVTSRDSFDEFLEEAGEAFGPVDVLVNNAGIMHVGRFLSEADRDTRGAIEVNLLGVLLGMKLALPQMVARGRGAVVNIASVAGKAGFPGFATYSASKHAVVGLSEAVRAELAGTGVQVSLVLPNVVATELASGLGRSTIPVQTPAAVGRAVVHAVRTGQPEVYVPRYVGLIHALLAPLPAQARGRMLAVLGGNRVFAQTSHEARAEYEARARASADGLVRHRP